MTPTPDNIRVSKREVTTIAPADTSSIELRAIDWRRIYRDIKSIEASISGRELFAGVAWGITGASLLSLIPLYQATQSTDPWVKPTFWIIAVASFIVGLVIFLSLKDHAKNVNDAKNKIMADMRDIHCLYFPKSPLDAPAESTTDD